MMTLPELTVLRPGTVAEAVEALRANPGARLLAGGTDIVPNLKYGMYDTGHLVALRGRRPIGDDVVVVKFEAVTIALGQAADTLQGAQLRPGLFAEGVAAAVLQAPDAEGEPVFFGRSVEV